MSMPIIVCTSPQRRLPMQQRRASSENHEDPALLWCCTSMLKESGRLEKNSRLLYHCYAADAHPPATLTHSERQLPSLPSTSTISVSHLHRQPTPFSFTESNVSQNSSSSFLFFSSFVVVSRNGGRGSCRFPGAFAGQCCIVVCR